MSLLLLFLSAVFGGALNSVAGGGSFITFPALLFVGVSPVVANATNTVVIWPAALMSAVAYRKDMARAPRLVVPLAVASLVGGLIGALVLLRTSGSTFVRQIPWLLLGATLLFLTGPAVAKRLRAATVAPKYAAAIMMALQLVIAIYGGYFGAGMSILVLALLAISGMTDMHAMNGLKALLGILVNGVAVVAFVISGAVAWRPATVMIAGAMSGGYFGARLARRVDPKRVRTIVVAVAVGLTAYFFWRTYA